MKTEILLNQSQHACAGILRAMAGSYFREFRNVSDEQLKRFESFTAKKMKSDTNGVYWDLWLNAEGEAVARSF